jgi:hypothetical protein
MTDPKALPTASQRIDVAKYEGHTPGPWTTKALGDSIYIGTPMESSPGDLYAIVTSVEYGEDYTDWHNRRALADAYLLADAPTLLAAVRALQEDNEKLRRFANRIIDDLQLEVEGLQDEAERLGMLEAVTMHAPCDPEQCECAAVTEFPTRCYRKTAVLTGKERAP